MGQQRKRTSVLIALEQGQDARPVLNQLRSAGAKIDEVMDQIGTISASVDHDALEKIRGIKGVASVEESRKTQLPPPESDVQ